MRVKNLTLVVLVIAIVVEPAIASHHRSFYENDTGAHETKEPDFETSRVLASFGGPDESQRVIDYDHDETGDDGSTRLDLGNAALFLDARISQAPLSPARSYAIDGGFYVSAITGWSANTLPPGENLLFAWFGWFNDLNLDGRIDDDCMQRPGYVAGADEFVWAGIMEERPHRLVAWILPGNHTAGQMPDPLGSSGPSEPIDALPLMGFPGSLSPDLSLDDRSGNQYGVYPQACPADTFQVAGSGFASMYYDSALLSETEIVVAAFPMDGSAVVGLDPFAPLGYDLGEARFIDVDHYEALNPSIADLWQGLRDAGRSEYLQLKEMTIAKVGESEGKVDETAAAAGHERDVLVESFFSVARTAQDTFRNETGIEPPSGDPSDMTDEVAVLIGDGVNRSLEAFDRTTNISRRFFAVDPREPNTEWDVLPGASYGARSDEVGPSCTDRRAYHADGDCNDYSGYLDGRHAWADLTARGSVPYPHVYQIGGPYGTLLRIVVDPLVFDASDAPQHRSLAPGVPYQFNARVGSWHDKDNDLHVSMATGAGAEFRGACGDDHAGNSGALNLTMESLEAEGAWPGGLWVFKDFERTGKASAEGESIVDLYMSGPVSIRIGCEPGQREAGAASARDWVVFSEGAFSGSMVKTTLEVAVSFVLDDLSLARELVRDVDIWSPQSITLDSV
ncbi:MAG: hypothetical protein HY556_11775 [Euryarchaeota archaeon]|nr:hypothetical protein [Euryarchaeota archaeon]